MMVIDEAQRTVAALLTLVALFFLVRSIGGAEGLWKSIDISEVIATTSEGIRRIDAGLSWIFAIAFATATVASGTMAYHFDFRTSWEALSELKNQMQLGGLGGDALVYLLFALVAAPSLLEMFGAHFARMNLFWLKVGIVGLAFFDLATDWGGVTAFLGRYEQHFRLADNQGIYWLLNIILQTAFNLVTVIWLFLASYGWELYTVMFAWIAIGAAFRWLKFSRTGSDTKGQSRAKEAYREYNRGKPRDYGGPAEDPRDYGPGTEDPRSTASAGRQR